MSGGKSTTLSSQLLALLLNGTAIAGLADNTATSPLTVLWLSLHTASPGAAGTQASNEAAYTSYARQSVARSSAGFTIAGAVANLTANVTFPTATGGSETETWVGLGTAQTGAGELLYFGPLGSPIVVNLNVTPQITTETIFTEA